MAASTCSLNELPTCRASVHKLASLWICPQLKWYYVNCGQTYRDMARRLFKEGNATNAKVVRCDLLKWNVTNIRHSSWVEAWRCLQHLSRFSIKILWESRWFSALWILFLTRRYFRAGESPCFAFGQLSGANISYLVAELLTGGYANEVRMNEKRNSTSLLIRHGTHLVWRLEKASVIRYALP